MVDSFDALQYKHPPTMDCITMDLFVFVKSYANLTWF